MWKATCGGHCSTSSDASRCRGRGSVCQTHTTDGGDNDLSPARMQAAREMNAQNLTSCWVSAANMQPFAKEA